jgi:hypothetical protein
MKLRTLLATVIFFGSATSGPAFSQEELIYVAVVPCRIVNTRVSSMGVIRANTSRNFRVFGSAEDLAIQGGVSDCQNPKAEAGINPLAVSAYIVAVPADSSTRDGILTAYPSDQPPPPAGTGATLNFAKGQIIGNTTIATLCNTNDNDCPSGGSLAVLARDTDEHVVIDVQGYFFPTTPIPGYQIVQKRFATANSNSVIGQVFCPDGKQALGGGGTVTDPSWFLDSSVPRPDGGGWEVRYRTSGGSFSAAGSTWAVCANAN